MNESMAKQEKPQRAFIVQKEQERLLEKMEETKKQRIVEEEREKQAKLDNMFVGLFCDFCKSLFKADERALSQLNNREFAQLDRMFLQHAEQLLEKLEKSWRRRRIAALCVPGIGWLILGCNVMITEPTDLWYYEADIFGIHRKRRGQLVREGAVKQLYYEDYPVLRKAVFENHKDDPEPLAFLSEHLRQKISSGNEAQLPEHQGNDTTSKALLA